MAVVPSWPLRSGRVSDRRDPWGDEGACVHGGRAERRRLRLDKGRSSRDRHHDQATTAHGKYYSHRSDSNYEHESPGTDDPSEDHVEPTAV